MDSHSNSWFHYSVSKKMLTIAGPYWSPNTPDPDGVQHSIARSEPSECESETPGYRKRRNGLPQEKLFPSTHSLANGCTLCTGVMRDA